jgi:hypothetical protein
MKAEQCDLAQHHAGEAQIVHHGGRTSAGIHWQPQKWSTILKRTMRFAQLGTGRKLVLGENVCGVCGKLNVYYHLNCAEFEHSVGA